eukprot:2562916-Amphidinium_carterae.1
MPAQIHSKYVICHSAHHRDMVRYADEALLSAADGWLCQPVRTCHPNDAEAGGCVRGGHVGADVAPNSFG